MVVEREMKKRRQKNGKSYFCTKHSNYLKKNKPLGKKMLETPPMSTSSYK